MAFSFLLFLSTLLFAGDPGSENFIKEFEKKWENAKNYTLELVTSMPEEHLDFKPTPEIRSFKEQCAHIVKNMVWLSSSYLSDSSFEEEPDLEKLGKEELLDWMERAFDFAGEIARAVPVKDLETQVDFFAGPMSKRQIMILMNDHVTHHRGQLIIYARLKGIKPPRYRGW